MARRAREKSSTSIYHIMLRGINRQDMFNDREDREQFISTLMKYKAISGFELYGYCLMSNHIHLLFKEGEESIDRAIKRIGTSYVYWYNKKYERCGHLFQDRFKSEPVEDDQYLLVVLRYIHKNPLQAGMVKALSDHQWSSYKDYINQKSVVTDTRFVLSIFNSNPERALVTFKSFMLQGNQDKCMEYVDGINKALPDKDVIAMIKDLSGLADPFLLQNIDKKTRDDVIKSLREKGVTIRQLARLTGIGRGVIEKVTSAMK